MRKILIVSGQTATGKTDLGVRLAKKFNGEIVSFDSRQAYRHLDIVTGKDFDKLKVKSPKLKVTIKNLKLTKYFKNGIPIWLYDLYDPKEYINAYSFCQIAETVIENIVKRGKLPIIVGGTVFYIKSFLEGFGSEDIRPNWKLRKELEKLTIEDLQNRLRDVNEERFLRMNNSDRNNKRRLIRAMEIAQIQNSKFKIQSFDKLRIDSERSQMDEKLKVEKKRHFIYLFLALVLNKEKLKEKIERRVKKRIKMGTIEELKFLLGKGYNFDQPGLNTLGCKQLKNYFQKEINLEQTTINWTRAEIDYARRQMVFLKKIKGVVFLNPENKDFLAKTEKLVYKWFNESKD